MASVVDQSRRCGRWCTADRSEQQTEESRSRNDPFQAARRWPVQWPQAALPRIAWLEPVERALIRTLLGQVYSSTIRQTDAFKNLWSARFRAVPAVDRHTRRDRGIAKIYHGKRSDPLSVLPGDDFAPGRSDLVVPEPASL